MAPWKARQGLVRPENIPQVFVREYLIDLNGTQAAIRAGYSEKTATDWGREPVKTVHPSCHRGWPAGSRRADRDHCWQGAERNFVYCRAGGSAAAFNPVSIYPDQA